VTSLHGKLFEWHRLQLQSEQARGRLTAAMAANAQDAAALQALQAEIDGLRVAMDAILREVDAMRAERARTDPGEP
jgi:Tfp pilus assembly protein PilO